MTLFEYNEIAFSMVQSFTVLRALSGIPHAIAHGRRYWIHLTWLCSAVATVLMMFWTFWFARDLEWNFILFAWVLLSPGALYVFVCLLVPEAPSTVTSWRQHFYSVRLRLFLTAIAFDITYFMGGIVNRDDLEPEFRVPIFLGFPFLLAVHSLGAISKSPTVHAVLPFIPPALIAIAGLTILFQPEAFQGPP